MIKFKSTISALAMLVASAFTANASEMAYTYADDDVFYQWGAKLMQNYDVAINLPGESFEGYKITGITVPVTVTDNIQDFQVWLTTELKIEVIDNNRLNLPNVMSADVTVQDVDGYLGYITYTLPEPYEITAEGIYVGYSFSVKAINSDYERFPVVVCKGEKEGSFFVHSTKTYRQWKDQTNQGCISPLRVTLEGDFQAEAVSVKPMGNIRSQEGQDMTKTISIVNQGSAPIQSIEYVFYINGTATTNSCQFASPLQAVFGRAYNVDVVVPATAEGSYDYTFTITKVNGVDNKSTSASCSGKIRVYANMPVKRPLMEEFTGTWCGWCPRGWVAMEMMTERHPDFVCISYHNGDVMQLAEGYPDMASGFPTSFMDRRIEADPYYGTGNSDFGIEALWSQMAQEFSPAVINLSATLDKDANTVTVSSDVIWSEEPEDGEYRIEYVLCGNGLYRESKNMQQSNSYTQYNASQVGPDLAPFARGGEYGQSAVFIPFNDVALLNTGGRGIKGSITDLSEGAHNAGSYTFDLSNSSMVELAQELNVVAFVVKANSAYGRVVNSNKCPVVDGAGIGSVNADLQEVDVKYYNVAGREVANPQSGLYIKVARLSDGSIRTTKLLK